MPLSGGHGHITLLYDWISFVVHFTLRYISSYFFEKGTHRAEGTHRAADGNVSSHRREDHEEEEERRREKPEAES